MKLTKPKVIRSGDEPMTTGDKVKVGITMLSAVVLYLILALGFIFAVGFAICMAILGGGGGGH